MILVEHEEGVARVTLDRAEKKNALTPAMLRELTAVAAGLDFKTRAVLLTGAGDAFCAGFDLTLCKDDPGAMAALLKGLSQAMRALRRAGAPVVVCAHGAAIAGGCALLGGADVVVTDRGAKLGYPVVRLGVSPAVTTAMLAQANGPGATRHRLLDPKLFSGADALRSGLAHYCEDDAAGALARADEIARALAAKPPHAVRVTKRWLSELDGSLDDRVLNAALEASLALAGGDEERGRLAALWTKG